MKDLKEAAENFTDNYSETKCNTFIAGAEWMKDIFIGMIDDRLKRNQGEFDAGSRHELNVLRDQLK